MQVLCKGAVSRSDAVVLEVRRELALACLAKADYEPPLDEQN